MLTGTVRAPFQKGLRLIASFLNIHNFPLSYDWYQSYRTSFVQGGLRSVARIFYPLLARKLSGFARILHDMNITLHGGGGGGGFSTNYFYSRPQDVLQMCHMTLLVPPNTLCKYSASQKKVYTFQKSLHINISKYFQEIITLLNDLVTFWCFTALIITALITEHTKK